MLRTPLFLIGLILLASFGWTGAAAPPPALRSVDVIGTAFRITFADGRALAGSALQGAVLTLTLSGDARPGRYRLDTIERDLGNKDILLYRITVLATQIGETDHDLCEPDAQGERWAFPLKGQWDDAGRRLSERGLTLACAAGGAIGKCVRWGYPPWGRTPSGTPLAPYHAACVNMVRANYCGDRGTTRDGMTIDYWDKAGIMRADKERARDLGLRFEAAWSPKGAVCVAHMRVPENMTLEQLARTCPRLRRLGPMQCDPEQAEKGRYGRALIFNGSY
ncbi:MAG TPA: ADYC domain-containing protein [Sphingomonas sp.]|nr:ADYC domain-containing protein [Sphingomonas sp.]